MHQVTAHHKLEYNAGRFRHSQLFSFFNITPAESTHRTSHVGILVNIREENKQAMRERKKKQKTEKKTPK